MEKLNIETLLNDIKVYTYYSCKSNMTSGNKYKVIIKYNNKSVSMVYHDNYLNECKKEDILYCFISDTKCAEYGYFEDFCHEFGYDIYNEDGYSHNKKSLKIYNGCLRQLEKFNRLFNDEEKELLINYFDEY